MLNLLYKPFKQQKKGRIPIHNKNSCQIHIIAYLPVIFWSNIGPTRKCKTSFGFTKLFTL